MSACECGCGEAVRTGNRFINGHQSRSLRRSGPRVLNSGTCPRCGQHITFREDGTPGRHWLRQRGGVRAQARFRCPAGESHAPADLPRRGKRVRLVIDVVIPADWSKVHYRGVVANLIRRHAAEGFVVGVAAEEAAS